MQSNEDEEEITLTFDELQSKFPFVQWKQFSQIYLGGGFSLNHADEIIVSNQNYFKYLEELMTTTPVK